MELRYDSRVDMGYLYLRPRGGKGAVAKSVPWTSPEMRAELTLDFDADGHLIGIEMFSPSQLLLPSELAQAEPSGRA